MPSVAANEVGADAYIIDVREDDEWRAGHVAGSRHLPMMDIPARLHEVPQDGDVVVACRSGQRSGQVVAYLVAHGWENVRNLDGGLLDWAVAGRPLVSEDRSAPHVA